MAVTRNTYTGNGSTTNYSFTFPYLEATDIKVSVNGTTTTAYTLANATTIQFNTAPANGASIAIYRQTDDAALAAAFYPGSAIRSADLNDNFTQNLYVTQESNRDATDAIGYGQQAISTANGAVSTANAATATANTASSNASAAVATANTASSNASAAVSTANTASSNATSAVNTANAATATANSAAANAATAISTANSAVSTANSAVSTANSAVTTAGNAVTSANSAVSSATAAVSTANTASTNASNAVTTANTASSNASTALSTANSALSTANAAASAVANAILYDTVANVAAIPASPSNNDAVEVVDSTGIESFTPLSGKPAGFVGDSGLSVRIVYTTTGSTWNWIQYFPNDPENRYGDAITTLQTDLNTAEADILALDSAKLDSTTAASTYQTQAGMSSYLTTSSAGSTYAPLDSPTFTGTPTGPSFSVTGSTVPTNGLYLPSANSVAISTNSTGRVFVDSSGRVGIGATPGGNYLLEAGSTASASARSFKLMTLTGGFSGGDYPYFGYNLRATGSSGVYNYDLNDVASAINFGPNISFSTAASGTAGNAITWNERLRITSAGLVGIGSSSPGSPLEVQASGNGGNIANDGIRVYAANRSQYANFGYNGLNATNTLEFGIADSVKMKLDSSGRLGIGTTSVNFGAIDHGVHIYGSGAQEGIRLETTNGSGGILEIYAENGGNTLDTRGSGYIRFNNAASEWGRWDSSGRLLVGTSSARSNFYNAGTISPQMQIEGTTYNTSTFSIVTNNPSGTGGYPSLVFGKSAGSTVGSNTAVTDGHYLGEISFQGNDGSEFVDGARITAVVDGTSGANDLPTRLVFSTTSDSSASPSERLRIASTGALGLSGANYGSSGQVLTSQGSGAAPQWAAAGGAWTYISSVTASSSATVDITSGINSTYDVYMLTITNMIPNSTGYPLIMRTSSNGGSSYDNAGTDYGWTVNYVIFTSGSTHTGSSGATTSAIHIGNASYGGNVSTSDGGKGLNAIIYIYKPSRADNCLFDISTVQQNTPIGGTTVFCKTEGMGVRRGSSAVNALRFSMSDAANINSGVFRLYGLKNS